MKQTTEPSADNIHSRTADIPPGTARIGPERWGKDHWSVFAYVETCVVDRNGRLDNRRIQATLNRHPAHAGGRADGSQVDGTKYSIRLRNGETMPGADYDEWDCLDDLEWFGLIENTGTGLNRLYRITPLGENLAQQVRANKGRGGSFAAFEPVWPQQPRA